LIFADVGGSDADIIEEDLARADYVSSSPLFILGLHHRLGATSYAYCE